LRSTVIILTDSTSIYDAMRDNRSDGWTAHVKPVLCRGKGTCVDPDDMQAYFHGEADIALLMKNSLLKKYSKSLHQLGVYSLYIYPYDIQLNDGGRTPGTDDLIQIDNTKPRLSFIDVEITEHCNLRCKGCLDFSNLVTEKAFLDLELFRKNLLKLKEYFWGVATIHLQGGEPLENPNFLDYVRLTHEIFPDCDVHIVTNGLRIPSVDPDKLKALRKYNCTLHITRYPKFGKLFRKIRKIVKDNNIACIITTPRYIFAKKLLLKPHEHPDISFQNCLIKRCSGMQNSYIAPCMFPLHINKFNNQFGFALPDTDKIEINSFRGNGWELAEILEEKPAEFCKYCHFIITPFVWKQRKSADVKPEDWIIRSNLINKKYHPFLYKNLGAILSILYRMLTATEKKYNK